MIIIIIIIIIISNTYITLTAGQALFCEPHVYHYINLPNPYGNPLK